jgi:hypothetical protein
LQFFDQKRKKKIQLYFFLYFSHQDPDTVRIRNTGAVSYKQDCALSAYISFLAEVFMKLRNELMTQGWRRNWTIWLRRELTLSYSLHSSRVQVRPALHSFFGLTFLEDHCESSRVPNIRTLLACQFSFLIFENSYCCHAFVLAYFEYFCSPIFQIHSSVPKDFNIRCPLYNLYVSKSGSSCLWYLYHILTIDNTYCTVVFCNAEDFRNSECCRSVTFWYRSGSADPYL